MKVDQVITEDEAALYDRQIRLWGVDAQRRLLASRILIIEMKGLGAEIAKNLVLGGMNCLTLLDSNEVEANDLRFNFLISHKSVGQNRAESCVEALQTLNPMVKIIADTQKLEEKDDSYFSTQNFDLVCGLVNDTNELERINSICRKNNVLFLCGQVFGLFGYLFVDFNDYTYIEEAAKILDETNEKKKPTACCPSEQKKDDKKVFEEKNFKYESYKQFLECYTKPIEGLSTNKLKKTSKAYFFLLFLNKFFEEHKRNFSPSSTEDKQRLVDIKNSFLEKNKIEGNFISDSDLTDSDFDEFVPVNAIMGGTIAQEVIKAISKKNEPIKNLFLFDGNSMNGDVVKV